MKKTVLTFLIISVLPLTGKALVIPEDDGSWYYGLGGERAVSQPASYDTNSIVLGGEVTSGSGFSCGAFNPTLGVSNTLNQVKSGTEAIGQQLVSAATGAIASLPMLMLQRANPGLYDMLMNATAAAKQSVQLSTKTCEAALQQVGDGKSPYYDWVQVSRSRDWKKEIGDSGYQSASSDVSAAKSNVQRANGDNGFDWIGGQSAGGRGMPPALVPTDIVKAGYNQTLNRNALSDAEALNKDSRLTQIWGSPDEAKEWSRSVMGELVVRTYEGHAVQTVPGRGLTFEVGKEEKEISAKLSKLVSGQTEVNGTTLNDISTPSLVITPGIIRGLKSLSPTEKSIIMGRLSQEIAVARVIEKALLIIRLLMAGLQEPNVNASGVAYSQTKEEVEKLNNDIEAVLFELDVNKKLAAVTGQAVKDLERHHRNVGLSTGITPSTSAIKPENGGIMKNAN
tara:strand:+ start:46332 stop:47687 length:1356 start_codon:yes stop_codon:yes gene_type:complete